MGKYPSTAGITGSISYYYGGGGAGGNENLQERNGKPCTNGGDIEAITSWHILVQITYLTRRVIFHTREGGLQLAEEEEPRGHLVHQSSSQAGQE